MANDNNNNNERVDVVITVDNHRHLGKPVAKGAKISVSIPVYAFLITKKIVKPLTGAAFAALGG